MHLEGEKHYYEAKTSQDHCHMACFGCGAIIEYASSSFENLKKEMAKQRHFQIRVVRLEVGGILQTMSKGFPLTVMACFCKSSCDSFAFRGFPTAPAAPGIGCGRLLFPSPAEYAQGIYGLCPQAGFRPSSTGAIRTAQNIFTALCKLARNATRRREVCRVVGRFVVIVGPHPPQGGSALRAFSYVGHS